MLKFLILGCVAVWLLGVLRGGRGRLIRDTSHLLQFVIWFVLVFLGGTMLPRVQALEGHTLFLGLAVLAWFGVSYLAARWLVALVEK